MNDRAAIESPCIGVCVYDEEKNHCRGCYRTAAEIGRWLFMTPAERRAVMTGLAARRQAEADTRRGPARHEED